MMKYLLTLLLGISTLTFAWETSNHIRTSDGDMIQRGDDAAKLSKLRDVKRVGSEAEKFKGSWEAITYYEYKTYPETYRIKVIGGKVADIEWTR